MYSLASHSEHWLVSDRTCIAFSSSSRREADIIACLLVAWSAKEFVCCRCCLRRIDSRTLCMSQMHTEDEMLSKGGFSLTLNSCVAANEWVEGNKPPCQVLGKQPLPRHDGVRQQQDAESGQGCSLSALLLGTGRQECIAESTPLNPSQQTRILWGQATCSKHGSLPGMKISCSSFRRANAERWRGKERLSIPEHQYVKSCCLIVLRTWDLRLPRLGNLCMFPFGSFLASNPWEVWTWPCWIVCTSYSECL